MPGPTFLVPINNPPLGPAFSSFYDLGGLNRQGQNQLKIWSIRREGVGKIRTSRLI